jgi:hypothetical protein
MVTTTPTVPEPQTRRPLPPVKAGDPQLTDADPQGTDQQRLKLSRREVEVLGGITTDGPGPALGRYLGISEGTVNTFLDTLHLQRLHPHHFPRSMK